MSITVLKSDSKKRTPKIPYFLFGLVVHMKMFMGAAGMSISSTIGSTYPFLLLMSAQASK